LQMALCGAVGGIVIVKLVAQDLLARLPGNHRDEGANSDAEWTDGDESDWMSQGTSSKETAQMRRE
jgi:hypothetical protein